MKALRYITLKIIAILFVAIGAFLLFGAYLSYSNNDAVLVASIWLLIAIAFLAIGVLISRFAVSLREKVDPSFNSEENKYSGKFPKQWAEIFLLIDKAGGVKLPLLKEMPRKEQSKIRINWLAFLLGPFYYLAIGLWRPMITYFFCIVLFFMALDYLALTYFGIENLKIPGIAAAVVWGMLANINYYKMKVLGEKNWF